MPCSKTIGLAFILFAGVLLGGCTFGYRHTIHQSTYEREDGRTLEIDGSGDAVQYAVALDFRYFRLLVPFEASRRKLRFEDDEGFVDRTDTIRERRALRLDVPLLSFWSADSDGLAYPGMLRHRQSLELWTSGEVELRDDFEWWTDVGVVYYHYDFLGVRLYGGYGAAPFRASTLSAASRFPKVWEGDAPMFGFGLEVILTAGEYGLDLLEYILEIDESHRRRTRERRY